MPIELLRACFKWFATLRQTWKRCIWNIQRDKSTNKRTDISLSRHQIKWERNLFDSWSRKAGLILTTKVATNLSVSSGWNICHNTRNTLEPYGSRCRDAFFHTTAQMFCQRGRSMREKSGWIGLEKTIQAEIRGRVKAVIWKKMQTCLFVEKYYAIAI